MIFFEYLITCPKCKIVLRDFIKAHFLNGAVSNPIPIYLASADPVFYDNMYTEGPFPVVPLDHHEMRYVPVTPVLHGKSIVTIPSLTVPARREVFESGSFTVQYLATRLGIDLKPPLVSSLATRFSREVLETAQRRVGL